MVVFFMEQWLNVVQYLNIDYSHHRNVRIHDYCNFYLL